MLIMYDNREDYVCEKRAGSGVAVYVIDYGVQVDVEDVGSCRPWHGSY
jgi:hypothetical protein